MEIDHCHFPDNLMYYPENGVWASVPNAEKAESGIVIGITSIIAAFAGKLSSVKFKPPNEHVMKGRSVAVIESHRFVGAVRTPLTGTIIESNVELIDTPQLASIDPYGKGWIAKLKPTKLESERRFLQRITSCAGEFAALREKLGAHCYKAFPDYEVYEIGLECAAVLLRLDELISRIEVGKVVLLVSDDPTAQIEMIRWRDQSEQMLVESRKEGGFYHFIVKKVH